MCGFREQLGSGMGANVLLNDYLPLDLPLPHCDQQLEPNPYAPVLSTHSSDKLVTSLQSSLSPSAVRPYQTRLLSKSVEDTLAVISPAQRWWWCVLCCCVVLCVCVCFCELQRSAHPQLAT